MKKQLVTLMIGLVVILAASCVQSCTRTMLKMTGKQTTQVVSASVLPSLLVFAQPEAPLPPVVDEAAVAEKEAAAVALGLDELRDWKTWVAFALLILSTLFGAMWRRARSTIDELAAALEDGTISKAELKKIIDAWKSKV